MASTAMVRVNRSTQALLKQMAAKSGDSMQDLVERAVETLRRETVLRETNEAYARLKADPKAWRGFKKEQEAWDSALGDGLDKK